MLSAGAAAPRGGYSDGRRCLQETGIILLNECEPLFPKGSQHPLEPKPSVPTVFQNREEREGEQERNRRQSLGKEQEGDACKCMSTLQMKEPLYPQNMFIRG